MHGRSRLRTTRLGLLARKTTSVALIAGAGGLLSGCASGIPVGVPTATAAACAAPTWPAMVRDQSRVDTDPNSPKVAAWGDPAIIARCGVAALPPTTDPCIDVDGVNWVARELSDGTAFTTFGTDPAIEVLVPKTYAPEPLLLPAFGPVAKTLPKTSLTCR